jgi:hypothetical protein
MRRFLRDNSMSIVFLLLFLAALFGQAIAGHADFNDNAESHGDPTISLGRYVVSSDFGSAVMENWQSEYLQFTLLILLTVWLLQRGSPESKELDQAGRESDQSQKVGPHAQQNSPRWAKVGGIRRTLYENSLVLVMGTFWLGTWLAQSITGTAQYNAEQLGHQQDPVSWSGYLTTAHFWENTLQNWQSEFLAVGSMTILAVYLRQRGSPESKPVGTPHEATGVEA